MQPGSCRVEIVISSNTLSRACSQPALARMDTQFTNFISSAPALETSELARDTNDLRARIFVVKPLPKKIGRRSVDVFEQLSAAGERIGSEIPNKIHQPILIARM